MKDRLIEEKCTIILYGPDRNGAKKIITEQIKENGLEKVVEIRDGIHGKEKERVLLESDFFILTSRFEGHPMGLIEALSYGLPCLVTTGSNMADEILKANAGWTSDVNEEGIMEALKHLLNEKDQIPVKGKNALELSKQYNWDLLAKNAHEKYELLLK